MERVLMHVEDPGAVLAAEVARCVIAGPVGWMSGARHPGIGGQLWALMEDAGFTVYDRVEELSVWRTLAHLERVAGFPESVERAVARGQVDRGARGEVHGTLPKIQIVAVRR